MLCETEPTEATVPGLRRAVIEHTPLLAIGAADLDPGPDWQDTGLVQYRASSTFHFEVKAFLERRGLRPRRLLFFGPHAGRDGAAHARRADVHT